MNKLLVLFISLLLIPGALALIYSDSGADASAQVGVNAETHASADSNYNGSMNDNNVNANLANRINARTGLNVSFDGDASRGEILRVYLSNGKYASVKIFPETASATAQARLNATCEQNNCTVELKETGYGDNARAAYEVDAEKDAKLFGFIKSKMKVSADVDAETGEVISTHKPWWAFLASETNAEAYSS